MGKTVKSYTAKEKATIALEALKGNLTIREITSKYGVHSTQIVNWRKRLKEGMLDIFSSKKRSKEVEQDSMLKGLYEKIGQQQIELDWLKKKSELFGG